MLSANACGRSLTLRELSQTTRFGEASISAQLRHLRKPEHGGLVIDRQLFTPGAGAARRHNRGGSIAGIIHIPVIVRI
jgi:hypothetical protein